jgi:hypothetical protein
MDVGTAPLFRQLAAGFSLRWSEINTRIRHKICVGFLADKIALGKIFLQELRLPDRLPLLQCLVLIYHQRPVLDSFLRPQSQGTVAQPTPEIVLEQLYCAYCSVSNKLSCFAVSKQLISTCVLLCGEPE